MEFSLTMDFITSLEIYVIEMERVICECDALLTDEDEYEGDEGYYWEDDVDETNYDPYLGCDFYDCGDCWE